MNHRSKKAAQEAAKEKKLSDAVSFDNSCSGTKPSIWSVAKGHKVNYFTLRRRIRGETRPRREAHQNEQLLSPAQEKALVDWICHLSDIGRPLNKRTLAKKVQRIAQTKRRPPRSWIRRFLDRHPEVRLEKPSGIDPKRARAFNEATVERHFELVRQVMEEHGIPWSHVYNMDEKGIQRGGHKEHQYKYFVPASRRSTYKLRSANLELVTVIECVRADGESLKPTFIFPGKEFHPEWFSVDPYIVYDLLTYMYCHVLLD